MLNGLVEGILSTPVWVALLLVFLLPALEASAFLGVVLPGEIAVVLGGVIASRGEVPLWGVLVAAVAGAVIGDQVGYLVGKRYGEPLLRKVPKRFLSDRNLERAQAFVRRHGAKAVVLGRWTALLRALTPGIAGMSAVPYARFAVANVLGGTVWASVCAVGGFLVGESYAQLEHYLGTASYGVGGALLVLVLGVVAWRHWRRHPDPVLEADALEQEESAAPLQ